MEDAYVMLIMTILMKENGMNWKVTWKNSNWTKIWKKQRRANNNGSQTPQIVIDYELRMMCVASFLERYKFRFHVGTQNWLDSLFHQFLFYLWEKGSSQELFHHELSFHRHNILWNTQVLHNTFPKFPVFLFLSSRLKSDHHLSQYFCISILIIVSNIFQAVYWYLWGFLQMKPEILLEYHFLIWILQQKLQMQPRYSRCVLRH